jgi:hypothetical protein
MAPKRPGWRFAIRVPSILLPLVLLIAASGASIPRAYLPMIFVPANSVPSFSHVFIIVLENHEYNQIIGDPAAPYFNRLAQQYGLATSYYGIRHPSLPNYIALTSGDTYSITRDCKDCFLNVPNIADQIEGVGKSWRAYMEGMPSPCFVGDQGRYRQRHNPFIYYDNIRLNPARCNNIVPFTQFAQDLATNMLPNYVWITPDICNDLHDCALDVGDAWLQTWVPQILASPAWQQSGVLFIIFDEGTTGAGCCTNAAGGQIATVVISPLGKPSYRSATAYTHYSLLRTIEDTWDMPHLANAGCDCAAPMSDFFTTAVHVTGR